MFLTVPMHPLAYEDYGYLKKMNQKFINKFPKAKWLDLQQNCDTTIYTRAAFNNEYGGWQHNTYLGMVLNTYQLCDFVDKNYSGKLPNRSLDKEWIEDFSKDDNFIYNQPVPAGMKDCYMVAKNVDVDGVHVRECFVKEGKDNNTLVIKVDNQKGLSNKLGLILRMSGNSALAKVDMRTALTINPPQYKVYTVGVIKEVKFTDVVSIIK